MARTKGLAHIQITVADLDRALRFYRGALGMEEMFRVEDEGLVMLRTPGSHETFTLNHGEPASSGKMGGIAHFGFLVEPAAMDELLAAVERAGGRVLRRGDRDGDPYAFVTDPDGYKVELYSD